MWQTTHTYSPTSESIYYQTLKKSKTFGFYTITYNQGEAIYILYNQGEFILSLINLPNNWPAPSELKLNPSKVI